MIGTFRDKWLEAFYADEVRGKQVPAEVEDRLFRKLQMIDDAVDDRDLRVPPSNHFEQLKGKLDGYCSIRINRQWRLIFHWSDEKGEASDLYLDKHEYR